VTLHKHSRDGSKIKRKVPGKLSFMGEIEVFAMSRGDDDM